MSTRAISIAVALLCVVAAGQAAGPPPLHEEPGLELAADARAPQPFFGLSWSGVRDAPEGSGYVRGAVIAVAVGPAETAGVRVGDLLVAIGDTALDQEEGEVLNRIRSLAIQLGVGATTRLVVLREGKPVELELTIGERPPRFDSGLAGEGWLVADANDVDPALVELLAAATTAAGIADDYQDTLQRLQRTEERRDRFRLRDVARAHVEPAATEGIAARITRAAQGSIVAAAWQVLLPWRALEELEPPAPATSNRTGRELGELLDLVEGILVAARADVDAAFAALEESERQAVATGLTPLGSRLEETIYVHEDEDPEREAANRRFLEIAERVHVGPLLQAARRLERLATPAILEPILAAARAHPRAHEGIVVERETPAGRIVIAGDGDDTHTTDVAVRIDIGGHDRYRDCGASARLDLLPICVNIDAEGDDLYAATREGAPAAASGGVALLVDLGGDDEYLARRWGLGAALAGVAILRDASGRDVYRIEELGQGIALVGLGAIVDGGGDDRYTAHHLAQGAGLARGLGALIDSTGDDEYVCTGRRPSSYGTAGIYDGWGQGIGLGFRLVTSGGIGLLADGSGDDRYEAGNFSQGGGYFFAMGILAEDSGNDVYIGSRYAQGFAAHQAVGVMIERAGNDRYRSHHDVAHGLSWDETVIVLHDYAGDDRYEASGFSMSRAAHNGVAVVRDDEGDDVYLHRSSPAGTSGNDYHGGTSLALFVDSGGGKDSYAGAARNDACGVRREHGIFLDLPDGIAGMDWPTLIAGNVFEK